MKEIRIFDNTEQEAKSDAQHWIAFKWNLHYTKNKSKHIWKGITARERYLTYT